MGKGKLPIIAGFEFLECLLHAKPLAVGSRWTDFLLHSSRRSRDDPCPSTWCPDTALSPGQDSRTITKRSAQLPLLRAVLGGGLMAGKGSN